MDAPVMWVLRVSEPCKGNSKSVENLWGKEVRYNWVYEKRNRRRNGRMGEVGGGNEEERGKAQSQGCGIRGKSVHHRSQKGDLKWFCISPFDFLNRCECPTAESESSVHVHSGGRGRLHELQFLKHIKPLAVVKAGCWRRPDPTNKIT